MARVRHEIEESERGGPTESYRMTLEYAPETFPVTSMEDAFPVIRRVYG
jgi:hypothetical protein